MSTTTTTEENLSSIFQYANSMRWFRFPNITIQQKMHQKANCLVTGYIKRCPIFIPREICIFIKDYLQNDLIPTDEAPQEILIFVNNINKLMPGYLIQHLTPLFPDLKCYKQMDFKKSRFGQNINIKHMENKWKYFIMQLHILELRTLSINIGGALFCLDYISPKILISYKENHSILYIPNKKRITTNDQLYIQINIQKNEIQLKLNQQIFKVIYALDTTQKKIKLSFIFVDTVKFAIKKYGFTNQALKRIYNL